MVAITLTVKDLFDDFFMAEFFTYCESKSTLQEICPKMHSPDSIVLSPDHGFLSLNTKGLELQVSKQSSAGTTSSQATTTFSNFTGSANVQAVVHDIQKFRLFCFTTL